MVHPSSSGLVAVMLALLTACGDGPVQPGSSAVSGEQLAIRLSTAHFRVLADRASDATVQSVADSLESAYPRVTADLRTGDLPVVSAYVWADQASFYSAMQVNTGQLFQGSTGYVFAARSLAVLAVESVARNAAHEFAHVASQAVNPSIGNNPRWLWETVALYENGEFVDPATLAYMRAGQLPTLATLDSSFSDNRQVYEVGYVLGEFVVANWGLDGLVGLVRSNGNVADTLGVAVPAFEQRWYAFLKAKYGVPTT